MDDISNKISISVIMPVLNRKETFQQAIESILYFTEYDIEIIVIDGGSTDGTLNVINDYMDKISYFETGLDTGICNAFNRGISQARGELIGILNSDDYWTKDGFHELIKAVMLEPDVGVFHSSVRYIDEKNDYSFVLRPDVKNLKRRMSIFHPTMFVRKKCYQKIGLYNEHYNYAMDSDWCLRAFKADIRFCEISSILTNMRLEGVSDINYINSLREYRDSIILNKVTGVTSAYFYYGAYVFFKWLMKYEFFNNIKRVRNKYYYSR